MADTGRVDDSSLPSTFLRLDRRELAGTDMVIRAIAPGPRERRRLAPSSPLGYLYERSPGDEPESDLTMSAGHYDEANLVWSFSGDVTGIAGLTEPLPRAAETPGPSST